MTCDSCPVRPGFPCVGREKPHLCDLQAGDPQWRRHVITVSEGAPRASNPALSASAALDCIKRAKACPHRVTDGSCQFARCGLGKGFNGKVSLQDCLACLKDGPP